ncbi:uncharacterized protein LOC100362109 [Rattus norvegicus]|uniref:Uncharacterized protein n=1 Tax=Rattus norvegicus TaxID=10116 RepID=F1LZD2_RAT|nr:uncharacterized protein LOC100362109 [Rattus norvegicus]|eukprot:XP_002729886.1 PREDICTED: uncharacterized protein C22orf46 homolog [Rattus norvegicus]
MLLPLLGACAVVGPFQGPEWEPVRSLLSQDQSCKDPRCCGNLLVFCLFLIWQIQQYWYQLSRTRKRNVTKVPPQRRTVLSPTQDPFFEVIPQFFTHGKTRGLDVHIQQWIQRPRWGYQRRVRQQWDTQYLLSPQKPCEDLPWDVHTSTEPIFCSSSFSNTCLLPQGSSWEAWPLPWYPRNSEAHPSLTVCQRMERLLAPSQKLVPVEPVSLRYTSTTLAFSLPNVPPAQSPDFCLRELLPDPLNQQLEVPMKACLESPLGPLVPRGKTQTAGREYREVALQYLNRRENRRDGAQEVRASGVFRPIDSGVEEDGEVKGLRYRNQRQERRETDGEVSVPGWDGQDQVRTADREQTEKVGRKTQREPGDKKPPSQVHMGENQEQFRCTTDTATQTPQWGGRSVDAVETPALGKRNEEGASGKEEAEVKVQGLETQGWAGSRAAENSQTLEWRTQDQIGGNTGTETEAEEGRNKDQIGNEDGGEIQTSGREALGEFRQQDKEETQAPGWEKQGCIRTEDEVQTPAGERGGQSRRENDGKTQASKGENQNLSRQEVELGMRKLREVREEDWVVIQAPWWGSQRLMLMAVDKGLTIPCWGHQSLVGGERAVDILSLESDRREGGDADAANLVTPKAEEQAQSSGPDLQTYTVQSKDEENTEEENGTDTLARGMRNLRGVNGTDEAQTQKLGEENQGQLGSERHKMIHGPKRKNQKQVGGHEHINNQTSEAENWEELTSKKGDTTHALGFEEAEEVDGEEGTEVSIEGMRIVSGAEGEEGTETKAAMEESQSRLVDADTNTHSSELKNQKEVGSEDGTEAQAPEKRKEPGDDNIKAQRPESKNQGQPADARGSCSARRRSWEQAKGENTSENGALEKKNWREAERENGRKMQGPARKDQRRLGEVDGKIYRLEWRNQKNFRDGNDVEIKKQGKRNLRGFAGEDGSETQSSVRDDQRQSGCETNEKIQTRGQRTQSKRRDTATEIQDVGVPRNCRAGDSKLPHPSRRGDRVSRKDAVRASPPNGSSGRVGFTSRKCSLAQPASLTSGYGTPRHKQPVAGNGVDSAPCSEGHLSSQGTAPAWKHRRKVSERTQRVKPGSQRQEKDKRMDPEKASSSTCQHPYPQSPASSVFPSLLCPQVSQAAPALACLPVALTTPHKWPVLKKSKQLLLESLMKRRIAHLRWGLPRRILESYLLFHFLESCSLPRAGARLPGLRPDQERQRQQERHCASQASLLGLGSPASSRSRPVLEKKSSKLCTQVQTLEKRRPTESEPMGSSIPPKKPRRIRPPGGAREPQIQEAATKAKVPAPRNLRPTVESRSWHNPGAVPELSIENSRSRRMARPGASHVEEKATASSCPGGYNLRKKECIPREASELPTVKCQPPTCGRSGSAGPAEDRKRASSPHTSSFKGSIHSAATRLSMTIWNKTPWSTQLAKPQHSTPFLTPRNPTQPSNVGAPYREEASSRFLTALEKDLEPPGHSCTGITVPKMESYQEQEAPEKSKGAPQNPAVSQKFGFMRHLRYFLRQYGLKK